MGGGCGRIYDAVLSYLDRAGSVVDGFLATSIAV